MKILVTGSAGFIGYHLSLFLLKNTNEFIYGIDSIDDYYDVKIKKDRLKILKKYSRFIFYKLNIKNQRALENNFKKNKYNYVINLAAQAGVRYSIINPKKYFESNLLGFFNILEASRKINIQHLIYASTSSVYGSSNNFPLKEDANTDYPLSFYAATKKNNEILAHSYSNIYKLPCTGLRFFTVYGPYGRPDMSLFKFTKAILTSKKINLFNNGNHVRDFTYIDDAIDAIIKLIYKPPRTKTPYVIYNIASSNPINIKFYLKTIEEIVGKKAKIKFKSLQKGDVFKTHGSIKLLQKKIYFNPKKNIVEGIKKFVQWYINQ